MRLAAPLLALLAAFALTGTALAQDGTGGLPVTPDPSECTVEAPTVDELIALAGSVSVPGTPDDDEAILSSPEAFTLPEGEPADEETVAAVTATVRELLACLNGGDFLYIFPFLTEEFITQEFLTEPLTEEEVEFFRATPAALPEEERGTLVAVREVTVLPDGRVGALVEVIFPEEEEGVQVDYFEFAEEDGRWLVDRIVEDLEEQYPPVEMGTPAA